MSEAWFITGTDTGVGKTYTSIALLQALRSTGLTVAGMKPVASGCERTVNGLRNEDAEYLRRESSGNFAYEQINPYAFEPPIAPHLAAEAVGVKIELPRIIAAFRQLAVSVDTVVVEGVGGWMVPVNDRQTMQEVAVSLGLPVILVVGIRLGCLNHALLTAAAVRASGLTLAGWVANRLDTNCENPDNNVGALRERLGVPLLADFPFAEHPERERQPYRLFDVEPLLSQAAS